ncbi:MAG: methionyl-tRNA formyltransferase [Alphaproteobacteria bacterium]|nr:methionyl-tRNA formyltransferase [Alphaproteobacteria bacterium]
MAMPHLVFFGSSPFAAEILAHLIMNVDNFRPIAVFTRAPQPAGRGMRLTPTHCEIMARENGIPVYTPNNWRDGEAQAQLAALKPDLGIVVAYGMILPQAVLEVPRLGCVNLHASLLPRWRGAAPIERAILAGDAETGVTLMQMVPRLDAGPMLADVKIPLLPHDTGGDVYRRLMEQSGILLIHNLPKILGGELTPIPQDENLVTYAEKIDRNRDCLIDFTQPALQILRQINAFSPHPGAFGYLGGKRCKLLAAELHSRQLNSEMGKIIIENDELWVRCGDVPSGTPNYIQIEKLIIEGKKTVSGADFIKYHPDYIGEIFARDP